MDWLVPLVIAEAALIWFAIKTYVDSTAKDGEIERLREKVAIKDEKIAELKEFIKDSK
jgi:hypothetical protein